MRRARAMRCLLPMLGDQRDLSENAAIERTSLEFRCCAVILDSTSDLAFLVHQPESGVPCVSDSAKGAQ